MEKTPKVVVLKAITPTVNSAHAEVLEYGNLADSAKKHSKYEYARMQKFWDAEPGSLEEAEAAQQQALQYMLMGANALNLAQKSETIALWSGRYTQATSEIYGLPEPEAATKLWEAQLRDPSAEFAEFRDAAEKVGTYIKEQYAPVFDTLKFDNEEVVITPGMAASKIEESIAVLADQYDSAWTDWTVERSEEKDSLSVVAGEKKIIVGMKRANMTPEQLEMLVAHEVLVHGLRAVNGEKLASELKTGLPGYLDAEEGLGGFMEYAVGGKLKDVVVDRYVDIAYALGHIDGKKHTRAEMIDHAMKRATARNDQSDNPKSEEDIAKEVYAHVNRIYRGSRGDHHVGVFTKDIAYYGGILKNGQYIESHLEAGRSVEDVVEYLLLGKFDPTNEAHVKFVAEHIQAEA